VSPAAKNVEASILVDPTPRCTDLDSPAATELKRDGGCSYSESAPTEHDDHDVSSHLTSRLSDMPFYDNSESLSPPVIVSAVDNASHCANSEMKSEPPSSETILDMPDLSSPLVEAVWTSVVSTSQYNNDSTQSLEIICELSELDVVFGRGGVSYGWDGSRAHRIHMQPYYYRFARAKDRDKPFVLEELLATRRWSLLPIKQRWE
jgi:hypothetical protein